MKSREVFNQTIEMKDKGFSRTRIQQNIDVDDFLANNKCAVVGKALQTWSSYQELLSKWWSFDDREDKPKPNPPDTDKKSAFPLVMAYTEGFNLWNNDDGRVSFRITPKPYKKVEGHLRGKKTDLDLLKKAINEDNEDFGLGQAELLYREGVYYLHIPIQQEVSVRDKKESRTIVGVDLTSSPP